MSDTSGTELVRDMSALFDTYGDLWNTQDFSRLKELWDVDEERPFYLPEERGDFLVGWPGIDGYWSKGQGASSVETMFVRYRVSDAKLLAPDLAQVIGWLHNDMKLVGRAPAMGGDCRFTAILRRRAEGWRIVSYVEAQTTALALVQKMYERNVSPEFDDFRRSLHPRDDSDLGPTHS